MNAALWDTFHDGSIESIHGQVPGDVTLTVGIMYICDELETAASSLQVLLCNCRLLTYTPYDGALISDLLILNGLQIGILGATLESDHVAVGCDAGTLRVAYDSAEILTHEGKILTLAQVGQAADRAVADRLKSDEADRLNFNDVDRLDSNEADRRQIIAERRRRRWKVIQFLFLLCGVALLFRAYAGESAFKAVLGMIVTFAALSAHHFAYLHRKQETRMRNGKQR